MKLIVSSTELLAHLQSISKVVSNKSSLPILDSFLFELEGGILTITGSDLESTLNTKMEVEKFEGEGKFALDAKRMLDILKEFPDQPLTLDIDTDTRAVTILSERGKYNIVGANSEDFPESPEINEDNGSSFEIQPEILETGLNKTLFAVGNDEIRPVMSGVFFQLNDQGITLVASDSHKMVTYKRSDIKTEKESSFILPKRPASLLKGLLTSNSEDKVIVKFDQRNATFSFGGFKMICRLTEGKYPNFESVIPKDNQNKLIINRLDFFNTLKRVSVFSSQSNNLIKLGMEEDKLEVSAQDIDLSASGEENLSCQYQGDKMDIGFKAQFLQELVQHIDSEEVILELSNPQTAALVFPFEQVSEEENLLMLLMPMMV